MFLPACRVRDSRLKIKRGGGRSFNRDFRGPEEDDNPFSLDNTNEAADSSSDSEEDDDDEAGDSDESDGFGGKISKKTPTAQDEARETEELEKSLGRTNLEPKPATPATTTASASSGGRGLGERKTVKSAEQVKQDRTAKKVEKKPTTSNDAPKNLNKGAPVQMSRREREEKEKAAAKERYQALHAAGKTDEAKKDMARLAAIRKQREAQKAAKEKEAADKEAARVAGLAKSGRKIAK
ncbi:PDGFA associated 1 family protein [Sporobolomyces koalae]|uniref:PDGFA associated 1 family protein n=1 Tax=Sporobolomyces koalae TaxID=500713 RepID=UPI003172D7A3